MTFRLLFVPTLTSVLFVIGGVPAISDTLNVTVTELPETCTLSGIQQRTKFDLHQLTKKTLDQSGESTEGSLVEFYSDGVTPRQVVATYFGETGKTEVRYYLASAEDYIIESTEYFYSKPIYESPPEIAGRIDRRFAVCGGQFPYYVGATENHTRLVQLQQKLGVLLHQFTEKGSPISQP